MEKNLSVTESIKAYGLMMLEKYKKAMPIIRTGIKFNEAAFIIRFDLNVWSSPNKKLAIGDVCELNKNFYKALLSGFEEIPQQIEDRLEEKYVIIAFVELRSKNANDILCAIGKADSPWNSFLNIQKNDDTLLLFWPGGLEKVEETK